MEEGDEVAIATGFFSLMDLTNLRESLESPVHPAPSRVHDERLTNEFRIAALQLTNLYKQGRKNAREAFMDGYSQALGDTLECVRTAAQGASAHDAQTRLAGLCDYIQRRLDALQSDVQDQEEAAQAAAVHDPVDDSVSRMRRKARHAHDTPKRATRPPGAAEAPPPSSQSACDSDMDVAPLAHDRSHPRKRRRALRDPRQRV